MRRYDDDIYVDNGDDDNYKDERSAKLASTHRPCWTVAIVEVGVPDIILINIILIMVIMVIIIIIMLIITNIKIPSEMGVAPLHNPFEP